VSALVLTAVVAIALAVALAVLLPGAGFIGAIVVVVVGIAVILWLLGQPAAGGCRASWLRIPRRGNSSAPEGPMIPTAP
jgi:hypothetical protein